VRERRVTQDLRGMDAEQIGADLQPPNAAVLAAVSTQALPRSCTTSRLPSRAVLANRLFFLSPHFAGSSARRPLVASFRGGEL
jgi:hypothetical protein